MTDYATKMASGAAAALNAQLWRLVPLAVELRDTWAMADLALTELYLSDEAEAEQVDRELFDHLRTLSEIIGRTMLGQDLSFRGLPDRAKQAGILHLIEAAGLNMAEVAQ